MLPHASISIVCQKLGSAPSGHHDPGLLHVAPDLPRERIHAREASLLPYARHEANVHNAPVEVTLEIEEVGLDTALDTPEGGGHPDVRTCRISFLAEADESCVDPAGRYHRLRIGHHVGRRETDRPATLVSNDYLAPEHVGT